MANKWLAAILNFFVWGLGYFYCGRLLRAVVGFFGAIFAVALIKIFTLGLLGFIAAPLVSLVLAIDAYNIAAKKS